MASQQLHLRLTLVIVLRNFIDEDVEPIARYLNNQNVARWLTSRIPFPYIHEDARWWVNEGCKQGVNRAIEYLGQFVGIIGYTPGTFEYSHVGEIGYWLGEPFWGKGIATESVSRLTAEIFRDTDLVRIFAPVFATNAASKRVLEKCGYTLESVQKNGLNKHGKLHDAYVFTILKSA